jgi:hypothetical protein
VELGNGFPLFPERGQDLSTGAISEPGLREALLDTDPATAFDPFLNFNAHNTAAARSRVYVTLHNSGEYELPIGYAAINGDLFNVPAGLSPSLLVVSMMRRGGRFIVTRSMQRFKVLALQTAETPE